ncbi:MAG: DNA-binding protein WhiA [Lachnospiraceae bacterium]|nr:DNA-binding protein WhiA [Lachnospiraceae bacterium]
MSFSGDIKAELFEVLPKSRHCQIAELSAYASFLGNFHKKDEKLRFTLGTENPNVQRKCFTLLKKLDTITRYDAGVIEEDAPKMRQMLRMETGMSPVDGLLLQQPCCKRSFIRGAFLATGSMSDPNKAYHFEIVCESEPQATQLQDVMNAFDLDAKIVERKNHFVVYIKEGEQISTVLGLMGANRGVLDFENVRVMKDMRNAVNRKVNCETANISKTVNAAVRQLEDIRYIEEVQGLDTLSPNLQEIAQVRLENPDTPLKDLGNLLNPIVGKSGVNHRLRRISEIADRLREERFQEDLS